MEYFQVHNAALQLELSERKLDSVLDKFHRPASEVPEPEKEANNSADSSQSEQEENNRIEASSCRRKEAELIPGINKQNISMCAPLHV